MRSGIAPDDAWALAPVVEGAGGVLADLAWYMGIRGVSRVEMLEVLGRFNRQCVVYPLENWRIERLVRNVLVRAGKATEKVMEQLRRDNERSAE